MFLQSHSGYKGNHMGLHTCCGCVKNYVEWAQRMLWWCGIFRVQIDEVRYCLLTAYQMSLKSEILWGWQRLLHV